MPSLEEFIREYSKAISEGNAAVFAGAGLSRSSGYASWKELVSPLARDIGLDVDKEHDLIAIAQYYRNERGNRAAINQKILNEFTKGTSNNDNVDILTRLPISIYWTTNYDELIEEGLKRNNRKADIKTTQQSLAENIYDRDAVIYKMHGDVRCPSKAVLTKDDYEKYENERSLFRTVLKGDLVSKTFLFIGFSFEDPNLEYILAQIRVLLGEPSRDHYCFFETVKQNEDESETDFLYRKVKQELRIKDLKRYGIQAICLESYNDITKILLDIEHGVLSRNIFISGSIAEFDNNWTKDKVNLFSFLLGKELVRNNYKIVSGFGYGIGSSVINGALEEIYGSKYRHIDEYLCLRPFPQEINGGIPQEQLKDKYRLDMLNEAGIAIFMFGNKTINTKTVIADGMIKEFQIAKHKKIFIIPIGSTGWAAKEIFCDIKGNITAYPYLSNYLETLNSCTDPEKLISVILTIVGNLQSF